MTIEEVETGYRHPVMIRPLEEKDLRSITKRRYFFDWKVYRRNCAIYKLEIRVRNDILGLVGILDFPEERRIEIKLLACSRENVGRGRLYDGIAGCLIAFVGRLAVNRYGIEACVSLVPKTELIEHYKKRYGMKDAGWQLYLDGRELIQLLKNYSL